MASRSRNQDKRGVHRRPVLLTTNAELFADCAQANLKLNNFTGGKGFCLASGSVDHSVKVYKFPGLRVEGCQFSVDHS
ncbi:hypothetical protein RHMOL_Rhmol05G0102800 [Rhododendron molle]|uniref:Uncharacterized protein n=1 Tax=Rhododendron molle TaxID=49168 RepID=A0ACC0NM73_RHOML|nr:hypothetical protein RHMOL_Rhmol05G0102800 [Rhododendron molle]